MASSGNFSVLEPSDCGYANLLEGNLNVIGTSNTAIGSFQSTMGVSSGKWYVELYVITMAYSHPSMGINGGTQVNTLDSNQGMLPNLMWYGGNSTNKLVELSMTNDVWGTYSENESSVSTISATNKVMIALDADNKKLWYGVNGTWFNSGDPAGNDGNWAQSWTTNPNSIHFAFSNYNLGDSVINFGQDSTFGGRVTAQGNTDGNGFGDFYYTPPTGFLALCSANLPLATEIDPAETDDDFVGGKQFNPILWTGNGSTNNITGLGFQPDLVWTKGRSTTYNNRLWDSSRGVQKYLDSDSTDAEATLSTGLTAFGSDGFTLGSGGSQNSNGATYIAWCWRANGGTTSTNSDGSTDSTVQANTKAGFSIIETPNYSSNSTFGHGLSSAPDFIIAKLIGGSRGAVYHTGLSSAGHYLSLNTTDAEATGSFFNSTAPTSSVFSLGASFGGSGAGICYAWHNVEGFQKFGSYIGNGNADGPFIYTGFRPRMFFIKNIGATSKWHVYDTARTTSNPMNDTLDWNANNAEQTNYAYQDYDTLSNGFKVRGDNGFANSSGVTYVYGAWGDVPFKYNNTF